MERKLTDEAFEYYRSLGLKRSYQAVAEKFGVSKVAVVNYAKRERWQQRLAEFEAESRANNHQRALRSREEQTEHHMKAWEAVERRALEAIRSYPFSTAIDAVRGLHMATRNMLLLSGEPTDRTEVNMEQLIRSEYERWMKPVKDAGADDELDEDLPQEPSIAPTNESPAVDDHAAP